MQKSVLTFLLALACTLQVGARIEWLETVYDYGSFPGESGPRQGRVRLVNRGPDPTIINRVKPTCGCTVAEFTEGVIAPGDTAFVTFAYNPAGRPGRFEKHIKVYTGENNDLTSITIRGTVIGSSSTLAMTYPVEAGPMRLSSRAMELGKVVYGRARHEYISGYNVSTDTLHLAWSETPRAISLGVSSKTVAPGDLFTLGVYFNTRDEAMEGPVDYSFRLYPQAFDRAEYTEITITGDVVPDTSGLSEQELRDAPSAMVYPGVIDLGSISPKDKPIKIAFKVRNEGRSQMQVKRVCIAGSQALKVKQMPTGIAPGKEHEVKAELLPAQLPDGLFALEIQVITNDPLHPSRLVRLTGNKQ